MTFDKSSITSSPKERVQLDLPPVIFGTSPLGNLFEVLDDELKFAIIKQCVRLSNGPAVFDSAGKYGAGLALETLGNGLRSLDVSPGNVVISNKLGWIRTPLKTTEPTFEPGVWKNLKHDASQKISYEGIRQCFQQGNDLLKGYTPQMVSVHDPDEYISKATNPLHAKQLYKHVLEAYEALQDLKLHNLVDSIGVGAKDWKVIRRIAADVPLDWVMIANSFTIKTHEKELIDFIKELGSHGVSVINAGVFHSGFLAGGDYYDYKFIDATSGRNKDLIRWRSQFFVVCKKFNVSPAAACVQFAMRLPEIKSVALSVTDTYRVKENLELPRVPIPDEFWYALNDEKLTTV